MNAQGLAPPPGAGIDDDLTVRKLFVPAEPDQVGVVPYRFRNGDLEFLLITSRGRSRWLIPKGGFMSGAGPLYAAQTEAYEEAGVGGPMGSVPIGYYRHGRSKSSPLVQVFLMKVENEADSWPEKHERRCQWMPVDEAIWRVGGQGLKAILNEAATLLRLASAANHSAESAQHPAVPVAKPIPSPS